MRHYVDGGGGLAGFFGFGWVTALCGVQLKGSNGPDYGEAVTCPECERIRRAQKTPLF